MNIPPPMISETFSDIQDNNVIPSYIKDEIIIQQFQPKVLGNEDFPL